jgi:ferredoxin-thioredoxin reductase catalytic subunit
MEIEEKEIQKLIKEYEEYAQKYGFQLNPDRKIVENIVRALLKKEKKHGARYCPCRVMTGDIEKDKEIICPCVFGRGEVEEKGHCICRLFVKK